MPNILIALASSCLTNEVPKRWYCRLHWYQTCWISYGCVRAHRVRLFNLFPFKYLLVYSIENIVIICELNELQMNENALSFYLSQYRSVSTPITPLSTDIPQNLPLSWKDLTTTIPLPHSFSLAYLENTVLTLFFLLLPILSCSTFIQN